MFLQIPFWPTLNIFAGWGLGVWKMRGRVGKLFWSPGHSLHLPCPTDTLQLLEPPITTAASKAEWLQATVGNQPNNNSLNLWLPSPDFYTTGKYLIIFITVPGLQGPSLRKKREKGSRGEDRGQRPYPYMGTEKRKRVWFERSKQWGCI